MPIVVYMISALRPIGGGLVLTKVESETGVSDVCIECIATYLNHLELVHSGFQYKDIASFYRLGNLQKCASRKYQCNSSPKLAVAVVRCVNPSPSKCLDKK